MRALIVVFVGLMACKRGQPEARKLVTPTAEEARVFGKELAKYIAPCDTAELDRRIDRDLLIERAVANRKVDDAFMRGFKSSFESVGTVLCRQLSQQQNVQASFLRLHMVNGVPRPLIRLLQDGALNYYELDLDKTGGRVRAADITIYMAGERLSELVGKMIDMLKDEGAGTAMLLTAVSSNMQQQKWQEAYGAIQALPAKLREHKAVKLMQVQIAGELGDDTYREAIDAYAKAFPNDPSLALVEIDHSILQKRYADALRHIDALDKLVGGDPYLDVLRGEIVGQQGNRAEALALATRASERAPELVACWWQLLTQQVASERYTDALKTLETLRDRFKQTIDQDTLRGDERFRVFADSPEYVAWARR
jgi:predicted Zn-dependent protease